MEFKLLETVSVNLQPKLQWLLYSSQHAAFVSGDEQSAFAIPVATPSSPLPLQPFRQHDPTSPQHHPCNLPVPEDIYREFAASSWHGFRFLSISDYDSAIDSDGQYVGDLLRMLVFGPHYGHYVLHPASGIVLSLDSGSMQLFERTDSAFAPIAHTRTRGRAALAFAAHPEESLLVYGDNYGNYHAHSFLDNGFGKARKIAGKDRNAKQVDFIDQGEGLVIGGMGYLCGFTYVNGKFTETHSVSMAVRDFVWSQDNRMLVINHGLHGVSAYLYDSDGFVKVGGIKPPFSVQSLATSPDMQYCAVTAQDSPTLAVYSMSAK